MGVKIGDLPDLAAPGSHDEDLFLAVHVVGGKGDPMAVPGPGGLPVVGEEVVSCTRPLPLRFTRKSSKTPESVRSGWARLEKKTRCCALFPKPGGGAGRMVEKSGAPGAGAADCCWGAGCGGAVADSAVAGEPQPANKISVARKQQTAIGGLIPKTLTWTIGLRMLRNF
jgi:hypothetical protein